MKVDKLSRYGIVARSQHGKQSPKYWVTMSENIQQKYQFLERITVNIQNVDQIPIWKIKTAREEGTLNALNYKVEIHLKQIFLIYLEGPELIQWLKHE